MPLKTLVKVSAVNNLSDARYCAGMGVDLIGFPLDQNDPDCLTPTQFKEITQWVQGVALVGELGVPDAAHMQAVLSNYRLNYLQLRYPVSPQRLAHAALPILLQVLLQGHETVASLLNQLLPYRPHVKYFLFEAAPTANTTYLQPIIHQLAEQLPILQGFQVQVDHLAHLLQAPLQGVALRGGSELKPGYKDYDMLSEVLEKLEV